MHDIERVRGDTYADEFTIKSATGPVNIAGCTFILTVDPERSPVNSDNNLYQLTGTVISEAAGRVEFAPTAEQADLLGNYFYDVQMIDGLGRKRTIVKAKYKYVQDITKL